MTTDEMVELATKYRDEWAEELRDRLVGVIYDDVTSYMNYVDYPEDITDDEYQKVCQMMEMSVGLKLWDVESGG